MLGLRAWSDNLNVILFEFLDDGTKLAQSCTGIGKDCDKHRQDTPPRSLLVCLSCCFDKPGRDQRDCGSSFCVGCTLLALVCAVEEDLSSLFHPVTRPAAIAAMVLVSFAGARRRAMCCWSIFFFQIRLPQPDTFSVAVRHSSFWISLSLFLASLAVGGPMSVTYPS